MKETKRTIDVYANIDMEQSGQKIKRMIRKSGYSVKEIQNYLHLSCPQPVYRWFHGQVLPTVDHLLMLSRLLGVHMEEFLVVKEDKKRHEFVFAVNNNSLSRMLLYYKYIQRLNNLMQEGHDVFDDFVEVSKIVDAGATNKPIKDYELSRYACYLIVQNGDPRKEAYFFITTYSSQYDCLSDKVWFDESLRNSPAFYSCDLLFHACGNCLYQDEVREEKQMLIGLMVAVGGLRASGFLTMLANLFEGLTSRIGIGAELVPLVFIKMFSSFAATGLVT